VTTTRSDVDFVVVDLSPSPSLHRTWRKGRRRNWAIEAVLDHASMARRILLPPLQFLWRGGLGWRGRLRRREKT
jgi:hypothetical protein